jgi:GT2 family glycosyltransferase
MTFSVVIPSRNPDNLEACVSAIWAAGETSCRIIAIDDNLSRQPIGCEYVKGKSPFIFARAVNQGIKWSGLESVIICNDDALLVTPGGFTELAQEVEAHPEYGVLSSTCNNVGNPNQWPIQGGGITGAGMRGGVIESIREDPRMVCFIAVYIPRTTIERVGLLDEELTGYGYDDDIYCARVRAAGLKIGICDGCFVDHSKLKPTFRSLPNVNALMNHNRAIFARKGGAGDPSLRLTTRTV